MSGDESEPLPKRARMATVTSSSHELSHYRMSAPFQPLRSVIAAFFPKLKLRWALDDFFLDARIAVPEKTEMYNGCLGGQSPYWAQRVQPDPFSCCKTDGLLYRPGIVNDIIDHVDGAMKRGFGVVVQGPHGVGKSHSLVNVVRKLESTGKYLVTFIPDCARWYGIWNLYDAICQSFGSTGREFIREIGTIVPDQMKIFEELVEEIDKILKEKGKKWVFIFDQVNEVFVRHPGVTSLCALNFPFYQIRQLLQKGRRTCVMSVSFDNDGTSGVHQEETFNKFIYNHPLQMKPAELCLVFRTFQQRSNTDQGKIIALTGGVPRQVGLRLRLESEEDLRSLTSDKLDEIYRDEEIGCIEDSLVFLNKDVRSSDWTMIVEASIACLLKLDSGVPLYDRKHTVWDKEELLFKPLYPLVLDAYQSFFREDLMKYLECDKETLLEHMKMIQN